MKRFLFLLTAVMATALSIQAQRTITGQVLDENNETVIQATVTLLKTDSTSLANVVTNTNGQFTMNAPSDGKFLLRVTYVGYKPLYKNVTMSGSPVNLGKMTLEVNAVLLKGAEVVKNMARVYSKGDTVIYNAGAYKTPEGSVVEELVKRLPGAQVSDDGTITINGKQVKKIKVDGKEFMTGDTQTAMKNLPTSIVERIKTYDEKSDLSRITGIDDGNETTVLDFGLKAGMNRGMFANVDAGVGTQDRYTGRAFGAVMKDNTRIMSMLNANNVNDMGFGGGGFGGRFGGGGRSGLQSSKMAMVNLNYEKTDVILLDGSVTWNHRDGDTWSRNSTENFVSKTGAFSESRNQNYSRSNSWSAQGRIEWTPDTAWNISLRPTWSYNTNDGRSASSSGSFSANPYDYVSSTDNVSDMVKQMLGISDTLVLNSRSNGGMNYSDTKRIGTTLQINRKLSNTGRNITLRATANYSNGDSQQFSRSLVGLYQLLTGDSTYQTNRYNVTPQKNYDYSIQTTYSEPLARTTFLQFSYQFQYSYTKSERNTYDFWNDNYRYDMSDLWPQYRDWNSLTNALGGRSYEDDMFFDKSLSRYSNYRNYTHTAEVMLRFIQPKYDFNIGVQIIPQMSKFHQDYLGNMIDTTRTVVNWSPTANMRYRIGERGQLRFDYRGSSSQPSMNDLLKITDNTDPLNIREGNPGLKPSFTQRFNLRFNNFIENHSQFINANANFSTTSNSIAQMTKYDPLTGGMYSRPENINGQWSAGGSVMYNVALDTLGYFNVNTETGLNYNNNVSYIDLLRDGNISKSTTKTTTLRERLGFSYRNDWIEVELNGSFNYNHNTNDLQSNSNLNTWTFNYGFNTTINAPWGTQFTTNIGMASRRGFSDAAANTDELIWNAQISQSFLQGKPLSVRLEFYDLLHQQSNFTRTVNAMMRQDTEYNAITSYVMLRVNYRLNLFGTRESRRQMRGMGGMGPGMGGGFGGGRGNRGGGFGGGRPAGGGFGGPGRF